jgi:hypothetical protein
MLRYLGLCAILAGVGAAQAGLVGINDEALDEVSGGAGIALSLDLRINADASGNQLAFCSAAATRAECRLAVSLNNRGTAGTAVGDQEWLVWKGFYGRIFVPYLTLDASTVEYDTDTAGVTKVAPAVRFGFGGAANKIKIQNFTISNMAIERDAQLTAAANNPTAGDPAVKGYLARSEDGFLGLRMNGDIAIDGSLKIFACGADHVRC